MGTSPSQNSRINFYCKDHQKLNIMNMLIVLSLLAIAVGYSHAAVHIALHRPARQVTTHTPHYAYKAVNGNCNWLLTSGQCSMTGYRTNPWLVVDLGKDYVINNVTLFNRNLYSTRLRNIVVGGLSYYPNTYQSVAVGSYPVCGERYPAVPARGSATITCGANFITRYLIVQIKLYSVLALCELEVDGHVPETSIKVRYMRENY